jgi:flagellar protein FlaG
MINTVKSSGSFDDPRDDPRDDQRSPHKPPEREGEAATSAKPTGARADVRLVIEQDPASGALVYKLIDRSTGEVVSEISRDDLIKMGSDPLYSAGKVIDTTA